MGRIVAFAGILGVTHNGRRHVAGLEDYDYQLVAKSSAIDIADLFDHRLGAREPVLVDQVFFERTPS